MKKSIYSIFCIFFILVSCSQIDVPKCENCEFNCIADGEKDVITNTCKSNYDCSFKILPNSQFAKDEYNGYKNGKNIVFQMITSTEGDERIADDEFTNILVFEIPSDQSSFKVTEQELTSMNVHYKTVCFCANVEFIAASAGCMQGEKQSDGSWFIQGSLTIPFPYGDQEVKFDARFE